MKRIILLISAIVFSLNITAVATAKSSPESTVNTDIPRINAEHAIVMEESSGRILFEKAAYEKTAMASTTKLMTALITVTNIDTSTMVTVSKKAASIGGSVVGLRQGEKISVLNLLYCLMLRSGNDAAIALAEAVGGTTENFCALMNNHAKKIGALNTNFTSPHGLDDDNHYTTAYDLAIICRAASENLIVNEIMSTKHYTVGNKLLINTNPFLDVVQEVKGGKTGFTNNAGRCIALTAEKNKMKVIIVLIGCIDSKNRMIDGKKIVDYVYNEFSMVQLFTKNQQIALLKNKKNVFNDAEIIIENELVIPLTEEEKKNLSVFLFFENEKYSLPDPFKHDYREKAHKIHTTNEYQTGQYIGTLTIGTPKNVITEADCYITSPVIEKNFLYYLKKIVVCWFCGMI